MYYVNRLFTISTYGNYHKKNTKTVFSRGFILMGQTSQTVPGVDTTTAKQEPAEESVVVDPARAILQGFAGDARVTVTNAMYSGSIESIVRSSSAMNVDSGMGGAAGKEDDKKKDSAYDH